MTFFSNFCFTSQLIPILIPLRVYNSSLLVINRLPVTHILGLRFFSMSLFNQINIFNIELKILQILNLFYLRNYKAVKDQNMLNTYLMGKLKYSTSISSFPVLKSLLTKSSKIKKVNYSYTYGNTTTLKTFFFHKTFFHFLLAFQANKFSLFFPYSSVINEVMDFNPNFKYKLLINKHPFNTNFNRQRRVVFLNRIINVLGTMRIKTKSSAPYNPYKKYFRLLDPQILGF